MSRKLLFIFFIVTISAQGQTSVYHPFPDSNAVWNIEHAMWWGCGPPMYANKFESYSYQLNGDTTINSLQYRKVYIPFVQESCSGSGTSHYQSAGYKGCLRQDTVLRKVYFVYPNDSIDSLLYDFNLQVGDTIKGILAHAPVCFSTNPDLTVISIDSILINSSYRKQWNYTNPLSGSIVEGIGSLSGLLEIVCQFPDAPEAHLTCFKQDGNILYSYQWYLPLNCNLIDGIKEASSENILNLLPNPAANELRIKNAELRIEGIEIYNVLGKKLFSQKPIANSQQLSIDVALLSPGIYFVRIKTEHEIITKKFIKQ